MGETSVKRGSKCNYAYYKKYIYNHKKVVTIKFYEVIYKIPICITAMITVLFTFGHNTIKQPSCELTVAQLQPQTMKKA